MKKYPPDVETRINPIKEIQWLKIRISEVSTGKISIETRLPVGLVDAGVRMGAQFIPPGMNLNLMDIMEAIHARKTGRVVDLLNSDQDERYELLLE